MCGGELDKRNSSPNCRRSAVASPYGSLPTPPPDCCSCGFCKVQHVKSAHSYTSSWCRASLHCKTFLRELGLDANNAIPHAYVRMTWDRGFTLSSNLLRKTVVWPDVAAD